MKRFFGKKLGENIIFEGNEAGHIAQVLRMKVGQEIIASLNDENDYYCTLIEVNKKSVVAKIGRVEKCNALPKKNIVLYQAMPKREYFETIVTKSVELGVSEIRPFASQFSVNHDFKRERVEQIVLTACKQCERSKLVSVSDVLSFEKVLKELSDYDMVIFANEHSSDKFNVTDLKSKESIAVIIGAEGGFSLEEAEAIKKTNDKVKSVSLGERILRCDTASVALLAVVDILSEN